MKVKPLLVLSLALVSAKVMADSGHGVAIWGEPLPRLAQMDAEERRLLQLRWERMRPEEQARLRQQLREQLMELPPEQRERRRLQIIEGWREQPTREREYRSRESMERRGFQTEDYPEQAQMPGFGFGRGFERRHEPRERGGRR